MFALPAVRRLAFVTAAVALFAGLSPAQAQVEKYMRQCEGKLCAYFRAPITVPDGWVENAEASRELGVQMLLPKGQDFDAAPAKIYVLVRYNPKKQPLSTMVADTYSDWKGRARNAKVKKLADVARANGKPAFERHQFEAPKLQEQGFEMTAFTADSDKDGNAYFVVVCVSANNRKALSDSEAAYLSILKAY
jgi:hypothetical protein